MAENSYVQRTFWCSTEFRETTINENELVNERERNLFQALAIDPWTDYETGASVLPALWLRQITGNPHAVAEDLLSKPYVLDMIPGEWHGKATMYYVESTVDMSVEMQNRRLRKGKVLFITGENWTRYKARLKMKKQMDELREKTLDYMGHPLFEVMEYENSLRVQNAVHRKLDVNRTAIARAVKDIPDNKKIKDGEIVYDPETGAPVMVDTTRKRTENIILLAEDNPMALGPVDRTDRAYYQGNALIQVPREVRAEVFASSFNVDMSNCHLSVIASVCDIPALKEILVAEKWWSYLARELKIEVMTPHVKEILKQPTYGLAYGAGITSMLEKTEDPELVKAFWNLPVVVDSILPARDKEIAKIKAEYGIRDAWGNWHSVFEPHFDGLCPHDRAISLFCRKIQSYEARMMLAGFREAVKDPDMLVVMWLHDGMLVDIVNHKSSWESKMQKIRDAIEAEGSTLEIPIRTDVERIVSAYSD
ncbi:MAG: hypothetical protein ACYC0V_00505 [Armatimonadota bacterium]